jgi:multidrug efflux system outer membrane protein
VRNQTEWLKRASALLLGCVSLVIITGCTVGPNYKRPSVPAPPAYRGPDDAQIKSEQQNSLGDEKWAEVYQEPELQELIRKALANNYDVQIAADRILEQEAQVKIARSAEFPTLSVGGTGIGATFPTSVVGGSSSSGSSGITSPLVEGSFSLSAAWTPDFWGQYRRQTQAARATLLAQTWAQRAVRLTLVQNVATAYLQLRALDQQLAITKQTIQAREDSVKLTQTLEQGGSSPLSDVRQAEQLLYTATSEVPQLEQSIQQEENAIQLLLGENPGPVARMASKTLTPPPQDLPVGLPSQLLERRPDIQEAEANLIAANAQIGVARAQFFPSLSISGSGGVGGDDWSNLFLPGSKTIYGIGSLTQPLFEGGKLTGQLRYAKAYDKELVVTYQKTIATAFQDVSNALIALKKQHDYRVEQEKLVAAAQDSTRLARIRYQGGSTAYLEVLTTDTALYSAQLTLISAQQAEALALVQLYGALGGGWQQ